jgi:AbrB family looped-hinge helix DNA binding protein
MKTHANKERSVHFNSKGQILIPGWVRDDLEIKEGTRASVYQEGDAIVLRPITPRYIKSLRGSLKGSGILKSLMGDRQRERKFEPR